MVKEISPLTKDYISVVQDVTSASRRDAQGAVAAAERRVDGAWAWLEPLLFALVGAEVDLRSLDARASGLGAAALLAALLLRLGVSVVAAYGGDFTLNEKIFIAFAWFPKATVQAALGPVALDAARALQPPQPAAEAHGRVLLDVCVLSILVTAPAGAAFMTAAGPRLLRRRPPSGAPPAAEDPHPLPYDSNLPSSSSSATSQSTIPLRRPSPRFDRPRPSVLTVTSCPERTVGYSDSSL